MRYRAYAPEAKVALRAARGAPRQWRWLGAAVVGVVAAGVVAVAVLLSVCGGAAGEAAHQPHQQQPHQPRRRHQMYHPQQPPHSRIISIGSNAITKNAHIKTA